MGIHVLGTGSHTPAFQVTNEDMAKIVETNDEWIRTRTGIGTRHISDGEPTWYMGAQAAKRAIEAAGIDPLEIGLLIDTTARRLCPVSSSGRPAQPMLPALT